MDMIETVECLANLPEVGPPIRDRVHAILKMRKQVEEYLNAIGELHFQMEERFKSLMIRVRSNWTAEEIEKVNRDYMAKHDRVAQYNDRLKPGATNQEIPF
jgi:hypothetical protein